MGVDFIPCEKCGETFPDCGPYTWCEDCGVYLCTGCANELGISQGMLTSDDCPYCSGEEVTSDEMLAFALEKLGITEEALETELKERKRNDLDKR